MLTQICQYLRNWFDRYQPKYSGTVTIADGVIVLADGFTLQDGQYFRIIGSVFNDGVHQYTPSESDLQDEVFDGTVWSMAVPPAVIALAEEIAGWITDNQEAINSPYASESFGGYSYSKNISVSNAGNSTAWQSQFAARLAPWRKI